MIQSTGSGCCGGLLTHQGHRVAEAADGHEAMRLLEERVFDVLLLDILMPGLNGFEVLQRLREGDRLRRTSVIVVSALDEVHGLVRCLEAGADDYMTKPVDKVLLRARINSCLMKRTATGTRTGTISSHPKVVTQLLDRPEVASRSQGARPRNQHPVLRHPRLQPDQRAAEAHAGEDGALDQRRHGSAGRVRAAPPGGAGRFHRR